MKKYILLYNDNTCNVFLNNLIQSIKRYSDFIIIIYNKKDIDEQFINNNKKCLDEKRGGGFWLWKPYIINETLKKIQDNDLLFYLDSKYYFTEPFHALYANNLKQDILVWKNKPNESTNLMKNWCKMDVIVNYGMINQVFKQNANDCWAGAIFIKKTPFIITFIKEWLDMCCIYENISDSPSIIPNDKQFNDHRHDQSLLSIMLHKYNIRMHFFEKKYLQNVRIPW